MDFELAVLTVGMQTVNYLAVEQRGNDEIIL